MTGSNRGNKYNPPVFIENGSINCFVSSDINRLQDRGIVWMSGNSGQIENLIEVLNLDALNSYFQRVILLEEQKPLEWVKLESKSIIIDTNINCIKKRYASAQDKSSFKKVLSDTINQVKNEIIKLSPSEDEYNSVFNDFYVKFSSWLNKFI
jgi:hypothetical protein